MKLVVAALKPTPILWLRASGLESPTEVPASTLPTRGMALVRASIASRSVVLPLWKGPASAMHRGPRGLLTSCPIRRLIFWSSALDWVGNRRCSAHGGVFASGKKGENVAAVRCGGTCVPGHRHCEPGPRERARDDRLREAIHGAAKQLWIASSLRC